MATPSIHLDRRPQVQYLLRIGDTCLIQAQRLCEWSVHAPIIEEDIALSNMGLDLIGQARALLTHAGRIEGRGHDEDQQQRRAQRRGGLHRRRPTTRSASQFPTISLPRTLR